MFPMLMHAHAYVGTVVAMEKEPGILKEEHKRTVEGLRDQMERELQQYSDTYFVWVV